MGRTGLGRARFYHFSQTRIDHHVTTCDFTETGATWLALGREAGFARAMELFCDLTHRYDV
jgi:hypothetical protein